MSYIKTPVELYATIKLLKSVQYSNTPELEDTIYNIVKNIIKHNIYITYRDDPENSIIYKIMFNYNYESSINLLINSGAIPMIDLLFYSAKYSRFEVYDIIIDKYENTNNEEMQKLLTDVLNDIVFDSTIDDIKLQNILHFLINRCELIDTSHIFVELCNCGELNLLKLLVQTDINHSWTHAVFRDACISVIYNKHHEILSYLISCIKLKIFNKFTHVEWQTLLNILYTNFNKNNDTDIKLLIILTQNNECYVYNKKSRLSSLTIFLIIGASITVGVFSNKVYNLYKPTIIRQIFIEILEKNSLANFITKN